MQVDCLVRKNFTEKDVATVFSSVHTILDVSKNLVAELESRLSKWPQVQLFGDIFVRLAPVMKLYAEYVNNFDAATNRLKELLATPFGSSFFNFCKQKSGSMLDVMSLLIMPVQRVPRYELLLRELMKYTDESHVDYQNLAKASDAIKQINTYINTKKKDTDSRVRLPAIQKDIKNCPDLLVAHRYYVREGFLQVSSNHKSESGMFYFFCFNDLIVATKKSGGLFHSHTHEYQFSIDLSNATVSDVSNRTMFRIMLGTLTDLNVKIYTFLTNTPAEKESWIADFMRLQNDASHTNKRVLVKEVSASTLNS